MRTVNAIVAFFRCARVTPPLAPEYQMEWAEIEDLINRAQWSRPVWWRRGRSS